MLTMLYIRRTSPISPKHPSSISRKTQTQKTTKKSPEIPFRQRDAATVSLLLISPRIFRRPGRADTWYGVRSWQSKGTRDPKATFTPKKKPALIAGLIKGNQWLIVPDHKAGYFLGGVALGGSP